MGEDVHGRNRAASARLRSVASRLSGDELRRPIDPPWTAAALFAHMAFWDRFAHARWEQARGTGRGEPPSIDEDPLELLNQAELPHWIAVPADLAVEECLAAADAIDRFIASLDAGTIERMLTSDRHRLVDRSLHRGEHLGTIEAAFPDR